jgi:hypothetical protein
MAKVTQPACVWEIAVGLSIVTLRGLSCLWSPFCVFARASYAVSVSLHPLRHDIVGAAGYRRLRDSLEYCSSCPFPKRACRNAALFGVKRMSSPIQGRRLLHIALPALSLAAVAGLVSWLTTSTVALS